MTTIQFLLLYYAFSVLFMVGFILADDDVRDHPWETVMALLSVFIIAPILFPINLGSIIKRME